MINDDFDKYVLYSMIKVNNSDKTRNEEGISVLKEIVYKRMNPQLVENSALEYMILKVEQFGIYLQCSLTARFWN